MCLKEIMEHETGNCDEYCMYCYNELPEETTLERFLEDEV